MTAKKTLPFSKQRYHLASCALRHLKPEDEPILARALAALDPWRTLKYSAEGLERYFSEPDPHLARYLITVGDFAAGVVCARHPWLKGSLLDLLAILPPYQRQGFGREVMAWLERESQGHYKNVWILVTDFNRGAQSFYHGLGYRQAARLKDLVQPGYDEFLLRKILPEKENK